MKIAKIIDGHTVKFVEVIRVGKVMFDPRDGWVLTRTGIEKPARARDFVWFHPDDVMFIWVRDFSET